MKVYRIENPDGIGAYRGEEDGFGYWSKFPKLQNHFRQQGRRGWADDFDEKQMSEIYTRHFKDKQIPVSGFKSMQDMFKWFGGLLPRFYKYSKLRIKIFDIEEESVYKSIDDTQVIFFKEPKLKQIQTQEEDIPF